MITVQQLSKYLASNTVSQQEVESMLTTLKLQEYGRGIEETHKRITSAKKKRKALQDSRLSKEFKEILSGIDDIINK